MQYDTRPLKLPEADFRYLFARLGPSLGFWRAAEVAALRQVDLEPPILDLGAGDGLITACVMRERRQRVEFALDPDRPALDRAAALGLYERFIPGTLEEARLPQASLGTVISNSVLEHIPRIDDTLAAAGRLLRPGGRLVFTAPTEAFSRWLVLPFTGYAARRNRHFQHLNLWPVEEWARRLERAGLELECVRPYLSRRLVWAWDALEWMQMVSLPRRGGRTRLFGAAWRALPAGVIEGLARRAAGMDLSAPPPGGGRLVIARRPV